MKANVACKHFGWRPASFWLGFFQIGFTIATPLSLYAQPWQTPPTPQITAGAVACSQDGQCLYTTVGDGEKNLFVSTNIGATWTNTLQHFVGPVACSGDGCKVAIADYNMLISTNHGLTFVTNTGVSASSVQWSESGNMLVGISEGGICITTNLGATWAEPPAMQTNYWSMISVSGDGRVLVAAYFDPTGRLRLSTNYGVSWSEASVTNHYWAAVACTADGSRIYAAAADVNTGLLVSKDKGRTWSYPPVPGLPVPPAGEAVGFLSLSCSEDGSLVVAKIETYHGPTAFISRNFGASWVLDPTPNYGIVQVACSPDGNLLMGSTSQVLLQYLAPPLYIAPSGGQLTLSWPAPSSQYVLQQTSDLVSTNWLPVTNAPTVSNYRNQVVLPAPASGNVFYRLYGPGS